MKYLLVVDNNLNNYLLSKGFEPIKSKKDKSIYVKSQELAMEVIGWHRETNSYSRYSGHCDLDSRRFKIEMIVWED